MKTKAARATAKALEAAGKAAVAYYRVSTREQGDSGLGLAAQRRAVAAFAKAHDLRLVGSAQDIESGKNDRRPGLEAAIAQAKAEGAKLVIAKIDRLSRHAGFVLALRDSGVDFEACDLPGANRFSIGLMALLAEQEREAISSRTRAALAELKARGVKLGCQPGKSNLTDAGRTKAAQSKFQRAIEAASGALHHVQAYRRAGWTWQAIADQLNRSGLRTRTGKLHTIRSVRRLAELAARAGFEAPDPREAAELLGAVHAGKAKAREQGGRA